MDKIKLKTKKYILGIDTSNYKTSGAIVDIQGNIIANKGLLLDVKKGERGLRQSEAFFQHVNNFPKILDEVCSSLPNGSLNSICAISVSDRPRPVKNSYMPVFYSGLSIGKSLSLIKNVPLYTFSHQEGHIKAISHDTTIDNSQKYIAFHFSGGTTEAILVEKSNYKIVGGTKDISYGQLIDRIGTRFNMIFPCGKEMDDIAVHNSTNKNDIINMNLPKPKCKDGYINLSGLETHCQRLIDNFDISTQAKLMPALIFNLFDLISKSIDDLTNYLSKKYEVDDFIYAGGVSSSRYIRSNLKNMHKQYFGTPELSTDNAVGTARLGAIKYANETHYRFTIE